MAVNIIVMRHGSYDQDLNLSQQGREEVASTGDLLATLVQGVVHVYTSHQIRAVETAEILCHHLGTSMYQEWDLLDDNMSQDFVTTWMEQFQEALIERAHQRETLVLVSHADAIERMAHQFGQMLGTHFRTMSPDKGQAYVLNVVTKELQQVTT